MSPAGPPRQATTIDEVIEQLDGLIAGARRESSRSGYFPALYRKVTVSVKEGIAAGRFEDGERMERLDVIFANRYLAAVAALQRGEPPSRCWQLSFEASRRWWPIVLQHLLLGMNAHINLDLGVAAARTAPGAQLAGLENDFKAINVVLADLTDGVKQELSTVWPRLRRLDRLAGSADDRIINFSISEARDRAWSLAQRLAPLAPDEQVAEIAATDRKVALLGKLIWKPGPVARMTTGFIRLGGRGTVPEIIDRLL